MRNICGSHILRESRRSRCSCHQCWCSSSNTTCTLVVQFYNKNSMTDRFSVSFPPHLSEGTGRSGSQEHSMRFINSCKWFRASFHSCRETDCSEKVPAGRTRSQHRPRESKAHSKWISMLLSAVDEDPEVCFFSWALSVGGITMVAVCLSRLFR